MDKATILLCIVMPLLVHCKRGFVFLQQVELILCEEPTQYPQTEVFRQFMLEVSHKKWLFYLFKTSAYHHNSSFRLRWLLQDSLQNRRNFCIVQANRGESEASHSPRFCLQCPKIRKKLRPYCRLTTGRCLGFSGVCLAQIKIGVGKRGQITHHYFQRVATLGG